MNAAIDQSFCSLIPNCPSLSCVQSHARWKNRRKLSQSTCQWRMGLPRALDHPPCLLQRALNLLTFPTMAHSVSVLMSIAFETVLRHLCTAPLVTVHWGLENMLTGINFLHPRPSMKSLLLFEVWTCNLRYACQSADSNQITPTETTAMMHRPQSSFLHRVQQAPQNLLGTCEASILSDPICCKRSVHFPKVSLRIQLRA